MADGSRAFRVRDATTSDGQAMLALLPRLASFDIPAWREPEHLWQDDEALLRRWLAGEAAHCLVQVAEDDGGLLGLALTSLRPEPLSHAPAAHLEAIALVPAAEGRGIGKALMGEAERAARERGARYMTLHVFASNARARGLYERCGYADELLRYIKPLD